MKTEIEVKFLNVDFDEVRAKLLEVGGVCEHPMRLMRRVIIEPEYLKKHSHDAFIRIRDQGDKVTLTLKDFKAESLSGAVEQEVVVGDFDTTVAIFTQAGLHYLSYQESKRETWRLNDVEIVLDEWPWLDPYIEIEGPSEEAVKVTADQLGFSWDDAAFGSVDVAYKKAYPSMTNRGVIDTPEVRFSDPSPEAFGQKV